MSDQNTSRDIAVYAGYVQEEAELLTCSSGGMATALARAMIARGGYVAGVAYAADFKSAVYRITNRYEELEQFKGSKYIDVDKGTVYADVRHLLEQGEWVLFFGLPCVVAALRSYLKQPYDRLVAVELVCHGPTSPEVHRQYVEHLEQQYAARVVDFSVKRKKESWTPGYLYAAFDNGETFSAPFYHTPYGYAFAVMAQERCYRCPFRGDQRTGDLMLGDFWGATEADPFWNPKGVSCVLVGSDRGMDLLQQTTDVRLFETTFARVVEKNPNILYPRKDRPERKKFQKLLPACGLMAAAHRSKRWPARIKGMLKSLLH